MNFRGGTSCEFDLDPFTLRAELLNLPLHPGDPIISKHVPVARQVGASEREQPNKSALEPSLARWVRCRESSAVLVEVALDVLYLARRR